MVEVADKKLEVISFGTVKYAQGLRLQKEYKERLKNGGPGYLLLLEHTPVITNGRFAGEDNFSAAKKYIEKMGVGGLQDRQGRGPHVSTVPDSSLA